MSNISSAQNKLSVSNSKDANLDIDNYSTDELVSILNIQEPTEKAITNSTDHYIKKFLNNGDVEMSNFFKEIKDKLLEELDSFDNPDEELQLNNEEELNILEEQYKENGVPDEKTSTRLQELGIFQDSFKNIKEDRLTKNPQYEVPIAQGKINPTLKNITTRLVNIDSKYRTNSTPAVKDMKYNDIVSPHTSSWSSTNFACNLSETLMNVVNIQMYSITIPYSWYLIDEPYGNTCFKINDKEIRIIPGNYSKQELVVAITNEMIDQLGSGNNITYNSITGKSIITLDSSGNSIVFYESGGRSACSKNCGPGTKANFNLGWVLGFRNNSYSDEDAIQDASGNYIFTSESFIDVYGPRYLILVINDYNSNSLNKGLVSVEKTQSKFGGPLSKKISDTNLFDKIKDASGNAVCTDTGFNNIPQYTQGVPRTITSAELYTLNQINNSSKIDTVNDTLIPPTDTDIFAIVPLKKVSPGDIITEFTTSIQRNERNYFGPVDIGRLNIKILDDKGNVLNLNGMDWSFILMVQQLYQY
tara:strand:- start:6514 stop:8103 length:1590 start_codon:yes stop_codon:yes gene_type:complete